MAEEDTPALSSASSPPDYAGEPARILESITDAFFAIDRSWRISYVNQRAEELLQHSRENVLGQNIWDVFPAEGSSEFEESYRRAMRDGDPVQFEAYYPPHERWYKVHVSPFEGGLSVYFADVTERKQMEQSLRENEAKAQAILDTTVDAIITIDGRGNIETFNQAAERIFGYEAQEVIGENVKVLMPQPYRAEHDDYIDNYHRTGQRKIIGIGREVTGRRKDGSTFPMNLAVSEVKFEKRSIFTGIIRDISKQRQLEQEILDVSEKERRRIGQDLHDGLGQMLTGIGLISRTVSRKLEEQDASEAEQVAEIASLIKEADQYARTLSRGLVPVELDAGGLAAALHQLANQVERLFRVECTFEEDGRVLIEESSTATHLYRIAQEAVSNAAKHGRATNVWVRLEDTADRLSLSIEDDGVGFVQDAADEGGVGIHIMEYRARIVGGTLEIHSRPEGGTRVLCSIPRLPGASSSS